MPYLELKLNSVNTDDIHKNTTVKYIFYVGEFTGLKDKEFVRSERENYQQIFNGIFTPDQIEKRLIPELHAQAKKRGLKVFQ